jgi:hypothetical protein
VGAWLGTVVMGAVEGPLVVGDLVGVPAPHGDTDGPTDGARVGIAEVGALLGTALIGAAEGLLVGALTHAGGHPQWHGGFCTENDTSK